MKPFNLEKALAGKPFRTVSGLRAKAIHVWPIAMDCPVAVLFADGSVINYPEHGVLDHYTFKPNKDDLCMEAEPHACWVNIYPRQVGAGVERPCVVFRTQEVADAAHAAMGKEPRLGDKAFLFEWEE